LIAVAALLTLVGFSVATANPPSGVERSDVGRATIKVPGSTTFNNGTDVVINNAIIKPGGTTGWHTHPGVEIEVIKSGTVTLYEAEASNCAPQTLTKGQALVGSGRAHMGRNEGKEPVELAVIYVNVPQGASPRGEAEPPAGCPAS
jgi:quercetin dioxygenase-like cupin family protein